MTTLECRLLQITNWFETMVDLIKPRFVLGLIEILIAISIYLRPVEYVHTIHRMWGLHPYEQMLIFATFGLVLWIAPVKKLASLYLGFPVVVMTSFMAYHVLVHPDVSLNRIIFAVGFLIVTILLIIRTD